MGLEKDSLGQQVLLKWLHPLQELNDFRHGSHLVLCPHSSHRQAAAQPHCSGWGEPSLHFQSQFIHGQFATICSYASTGYQLKQLSLALDLFISACLLGASSSLQLLFYEDETKAALVLLLQRRNAQSSVLPITHALYGFASEFPPTLTKIQRSPEILSQTKSLS